MTISCLQHECLGNGGSRNDSAAHPCFNKDLSDLSICCVLSHRKVLSSQSSSFMLQKGTQVSPVLILSPPQPPAPWEITV